MGWHQIKVQCSAERTEFVENQFLGLGAVSVMLQDAADQPLLEPKPGETPLWDQSIVTGIFESGAEPLALQAELALRLHHSEAHTLLCEYLPDQDWERAWMDHYQPMQFGQRLWIVPSHLEPPVADAVNLRLDPGLAFGTGTHPTTALCLRWLEGQSLEGQTVLDFGCGSGILAIAALLLGAERADITDIDPQAIQASQSNADINGVHHKINELATGQAPQQAIDVLVANILAGPLIELAPQFAEYAPKGCRLALSGLLKEQVPAIVERYAQWFELSEPEYEDGWALVTGQRR
ncbi:ribosomal protein L11 methyltransferase [gamma proteobacterium HTCC5015]|nr:ribosomal protein L11 methyltransferase [gamma proteobacterium HTCC5015]